MHLHISRPPNVSQHDGRRWAQPKSTAQVVVLVLASSLVGGCAPTVKYSPPRRPAKLAEAQAENALVQFSLIAALAAGNYVDGAPLRDVLAAGDFGLGTFSRLDGEMILLDGEMYQALDNGTVRRAELRGTTPFAAVTFFDDDGPVEKISADSLEDLDQQLDRTLPRRNAPYALRIDGDFAALTLRSVPRQSPPFRPLVEVVKHQVTWQNSNVRGTLVGLRCPGWIGTLNVAGYHWHFLSDDRKIGGHVLACQFHDGSLRFDECESIDIRVPRPGEFDNFEADTVKTEDIHQIERERDPAGRP